MHMLIDPKQLFISQHAQDKFRARSNQVDLKPHELRRAIRYLLETGEQGTRNEQPVIRSQGYIFVISENHEAVITVFHNEKK